MQHNLLAVKLVVDKHLHVVFFLRHVNRHVYTTTFHFDWNGFGVVLVLKEERELLLDSGQLQRHERKLDFGT